mgnify:CR=1 FL=1
MVALVAGLCVQKPEGIKTTPQIQPAEELKLSDFPEKFKEKTVIVLGDNATEIERQAAEELSPEERMVLESTSAEDYLVAEILQMMFQKISLLQHEEMVQQAFALVTEKLSFTEEKRQALQQYLLMEALKAIAQERGWIWASALPKLQQLESQLSEIEADLGAKRTEFLQALHFQFVNAKNAVNAQVDTRKRELIAEGVPVEGAIRQAVEELLPAERMILECSSADDYLISRIWQMMFLEAVSKLSVIWLEWRYEGV